MKSFVTDWPAGGGLSQAARSLQIHLVAPAQPERFDVLLAPKHYLGSLPSVGDFRRQVVGESLIVASVAPQSVALNAAIFNAEIMAGTKGVLLPSPTHSENHGHTQRPTFAIKADTPKLKPPPSLAARRFFDRALRSVSLLCDL